MRDILGAGRSVYMERFLGIHSADRYVSGEKSLICIIVELAVTDCKSLTKEGIIVNGRCVNRWPRENGLPKVFLHDYSRIEDVIELLGFMRSNGLSVLLDAIGNDLDAEKVNKHLGLTESNSSGSLSGKKVT